MQPGPYRIPEYFTPNARYSVDRLEETAQGLVASFPNVVMLRYGLALDILAYFLGIERVYFALHPGIDTTNATRDLREFFETDPADPFMRFRHQAHVESLAQSLFNLQDTPGLPQRLGRLHAENVEAALGEIDCASFFAAPEFKLRFVEPSGRKGKDYEAEFTLPNGAIVCCEVKTKERTTKLSQSTIRSTLDKARGQLPRDKPGVVLMRIPTSWMYEADAVTTIESATAQVFRQSRRLVAAIFAWDHWEKLQGEGWACATVMLRFFNPKSSFYTEAIKNAFMISDAFRGPDHVSLHNVALRTLIWSQHTTAT